VEQQLNELLVQLIAAMRCEVRAVGELREQT
jgi:hypothetical protein